MPIPIPSNPATTADSITSHYEREMPECLKLWRYRTTYQIVWTCVATVFACTWVAIHPNIPSPYDSGFRRLKRRILLAVVAIICPEMIATWAARQFVAARAIKKQFNLFYNNGYGPGISLVEEIKRWLTGPPQKSPAGWTLTHAFFVQMGGFVLYHNETPVHVLTFNRLLYAIKAGHIKAPHISEGEINDKSKGDGLGKLVVVLQTSWFVAQCCGRWTSHLPLSELEVLTLAFAVLNAIIYGMWWSKPQGVLVPIKLTYTGSDSKFISPMILSTLYSTLDLDSTIIHKSPDYHPVAGSSPLMESDASLGDGFIDPKSFKKRSFDWFRQRFARLSEDAGIFRLIFTALSSPLSTAKAGFEYFVHVVQKITGTGKFSIRKARSPMFRVPMFYADMEGDDVHIEIFAFCFLPIIFGGLHLIIWSTPFFSPLAQLLWRVAGLYITIGPPLILGSCLYTKSLLNSNRIGEPGRVVLTISMLVNFILYTIARGVLIFISVYALWSLPEDVYRDIRWADVMPHMHI